MQVTLNALPASLAEFRNLSLNTPDEVVAGFLCALNLYVKKSQRGCGGHEHPAGAPAHDSL